MTKRQRIIILFGLLTLMFSGCTNQSAQTSNLPTEESGAQSSPYEIFVQKIQSENLDVYGIDMVALFEDALAKHNPYFTADFFTDIDYTLEKCNFSLEDELSLNDMIVVIRASRNSMTTVDRYYLTVVLAIVSNREGQLDLVWHEEITDSSGANTTYEVMDITGDGRDEIILKKSVRYEDSLNILTWLPEQNDMLLIFDEELWSYTAHFPYQFDNSYQFVPSSSGGYDIILSSRIYHYSNDVLESGTSRFIFNGNKYIVRDPYYDYHARCEAIAEDMRRFSE